MRQWAIISLSLFFIGLCAFTAESRERRDPFSAQFADDVIRVQPGETFQFKVKFKVPKNHYLYDDKTVLLFDQKADFDQIQSYRPAAEDHYDNFFKKNLKVHFKDFQQTIFFKVPPGAKPGRRTLEARLKYQGCSDDFCYRPVKKTILLPVEVVPPLAQLSDAASPGVP
ncbi:MAG: protein-disulfide reductase DsbD N-terminal domain-containing protein, partial [bacterium]|nr:protein-disulfide reductase DsbD N-terminal domain-containing protein [bacterium]